MSNWDSMIHNMECILYDVFQCPSFLFWDDENQEVQLGGEEIVVPSSSNMGHILSSYPTSL